MSRTAEIYVEEIVHAAHWLPGYDGDCRNLHGHSWRIQVLLLGVVDSQTGMVVDFREIKALIKQLDHTEINRFITNPTAENIASWLLERVMDLVPRARFLSAEVRVWETPRSMVKVRCA